MYTAIVVAIAAGAVLAELRRLDRRVQWLLDARERDLKGKCK